MKRPPDASEPPAQVDPEFTSLSAEDAPSDEDAEVEDAEVEENIEDFQTLLNAELATDATQHYLNQIGLRPLLTVQEEIHFSTLAKQGDFPARQKMIEHNLRLVVSIAKWSLIVPTSQVVLKFSESMHEARHYLRMLI